MKRCPPAGREVKWKTLDWQYNDVWHHGYVTQGPTETRGRKRPEYYTCDRRKEGTIGQRFSEPSAIATH